MASQKVICSTQCYCGKVSIDVLNQVKPHAAGICTCNSCRRAHSSSLYAVAYVKEENTSIHDPEKLIHHYKSPTSPVGIVRSFCSACGTRVYNQLSLSKQLFLSFGMSEDEIEKQKMPPGNYLGVFQGSMDSVPPTFEPKEVANCLESIIPMHWIAGNLEEQGGIETFHTLFETLPDNKVLKSQDALKQLASNDLPELSYPIKARCYCGSVKMEIAAESSGVAFCHCDSCKRSHAAPIYHCGLLKADLFKITQGEDLVKSGREAIGKTEGIDRCFCKKCGCRVFNRTIIKQDVSPQLTAGEYRGVFPALFEIDLTKHRLGEHWQKPLFHLYWSRAILKEQMKNDGIAKFDTFPGAK
mmetsp:Transcript_16832/g.25145  ORF Transcript_16832/g.25145 Transcript_16832/m.25145 type:complete len:356 (-) Transcript_16832:11-1078(-)